MSLIKFAIVLLTTIRAQALFAVPLPNFSGKWEGKGRYSVEDNETDHCQSVKWQIKQTHRKFEISSSEYNCDIHSGRFQTQTFDIQGFYLILNGERVGYFDHDGVQINQWATPGIIKYDVHFDSANQNMIYFSYTMYGDAVESIDSILVRNATEYP